LCTSHFHVHVDLIIATTKIKTFTIVAMITAKVRMVIKVPAF